MSEILKSSRSIVFVSGPFTDPGGDPLPNIYRALSVGLQLSKWGHTPIIPHSMYGPLGDGHNERQIMPYDAAMRCCFDLVRASDFVLLLEGWEDSKGACMEAAYAKALGKVVFQESSNVDLRELSGLPLALNFRITDREYWSPVGV